MSYPWQQTHRESRPQWGPTLKRRNRISIFISWIRFNFSHHGRNAFSASVWPIWVIRSPASSAMVVKVNTDTRHSLNLQVGLTLVDGRPIFCTSHRCFQWILLIVCQIRSNQDFSCNTKVCEYKKLSRLWPHSNIQMGINAQLCPASSKSKQELLCRFLQVVTTWADTA